MTLIIVWILAFCYGRLMAYGVDHEFITKWQAVGISIVFFLVVIFGSEILGIL